MSRDDLADRPMVSAETPATTFVVLVHDHGYVQPHRKPRVGPLETAVKFSTEESAIKAALSFLRRRGKEWTVEVVRNP